MNTGRSFTEVLAMRGRVVLFTPNAAVGLRFEQHAERQHATVVTTRGWADPYGPLGIWHRIHAAREYGVLSCDQERYTTRRIPCTDIVWVGDTGSLHVNPHIFHRFHMAMNRWLDTPDVRQWVIQEGDL